MQALLETTEWASCIPNHTYLIDGMKMIAYIKKGTKTPHWFSAPLPFSKKGRTFKVLTKNPFGKGPCDPDVVEVKGSRGDVYEVNIREKTCTCPGYMYHGKCKHISLAMKGTK